MIELPQKRIRLANGIELDTVDLGPREAPALIFLHGFPESHRTWRHQIAHLSGRFRCIAPDQRGYRGSSKPEEDPAEYTGDKLVQDVFALADAMDVREFTIVGHDWGGAIAWGVALAGQITSRVRRAVIANAPHPAIFQNLLWTNPRQRAASQYVRAFRDRTHDNLIRQHGLAGLLLKVVRWELPAALEPEERDHLFSGWRDPDAAIGMLNWYRASRFEVPEVDEFDAAPEGGSATFPRINVPTLVVWGMDDIALPPANVEGLEKFVEDLTIVRVPDCGHFVPWEAPEAVNKAMDDFLASDGSLRQHTDPA